MAAAILDRLEAIAGELDALRGEVDPTLWLDLQRVVEALVEAIESEPTHEPGCRGHR
jgi:hypothetical protein